MYTLLLPAGDNALTVFTQQIRAGYYIMKQ